MSEDTTISDDNIADVDLITTPLDAPADGKPAEIAEPPKEDGATPTDTPENKDSKPADAKATEATAKPDEAEQTTEPKPDDKPAEQSKDDQRARAQQEYANRQRVKNQVAQQLDQHYGPKTEQQLQDEGMEAVEAKIEAMRSEMAYSQQRTQIAELNAGMQAEAVNAEADFGVFNPKSPDYDESFTKDVEAAYKQAARLEIDDTTGMVLNAEVPLYDFYQRMAGIYERGASKGAATSQQQTLEMMARTEDASGSSTASRGGTESLAEMEARLADSSIL
jgi:hypothetical protein